MIFKGLLLLCAVLLCQGCVLKPNKIPDLNDLLSKGISSNGFVNIGPSTFMLNVFHETKDKHDAAATKTRPTPPKNPITSDVMTDFLPIDIVPNMSPKHIFADIDTRLHGSPYSKLHREPRNGLPPLTSLLDDTFGKAIREILENPKKEKNRPITVHNAGDEYIMIELIPNNGKKPIVPKPTYVPKIVMKDFIKQKKFKHSTPAAPEAPEANKISDFEDTDDNDVKLEEEPAKGIITDKNEVNIKILSEDTSTVIPEMSDKVSTHYPRL